MKRIIICLLCIVTSVAIHAQNKGANPVLDNIHARKSVRNYKVNPNGKAISISRDTLEIIVRAGMAAPTAMNKQPWEFYIVTRGADGVSDPMDDMASKLPYAKMLKTAGAAIVVVGNPQVGNLWQHDCAAAAENILLAIESMGLGGVWTAAYPYEDRAAAVKSALGIPDPFQPLCVIPIGYPAGETKAKDKWKPEKVHYNKW